MNMSKFDPSAFESDVSFIRIPRFTWPSPPEPHATNWLLQLEPDASIHCMCREAAEKTVCCTEEGTSPSGDRENDGTRDEWMGRRAVRVCIPYEYFGLDGDEIGNWRMRKRDVKYCYGIRVLHKESQHRDDTEVYHVAYLVYTIGVTSRPS
jgi:hypothetical protein